MTSQQWHRTDGKIRTRTSKTINNHPCTPIQPCLNLSILLPIGWCPENFVMMSLTVQELPCWQTNTQTNTNKNNTNVAAKDQTNDNAWRHLYQLLLHPVPLVKLKRSVKLICQLLLINVSVQLVYTVYHHNLHIGHTYNQTHSFINSTGPCIKVLKRYTSGILSFNTLQRPRWAYQIATTIFWLARSGFV